ncbi:hypothetical protein [Bacillus cereus]|uniref:hypothetical protein n=1 Tax=Bacillus cereus TaxID=1396 RepID=UPI002404D2C1|nr:hypothetical protein [Bacillus cereus]MDF9474543.1 hypothetical protein [Bacillus cereus]
MNAWIGDFVGWFTSATVGATIAGHFVKKGIEQRFNKELTKYNSELTKERNKELADYNSVLTEKLEGIKAELQSNNNKEQVKYSSLHEDRKTIVAELNTKLLLVDSSVSNLLGLNGEIIETLSIEKAEMKFAEVAKTMDDFYQYHRSKKIYLSKDTNRIIYTLIGSLQITVGHFFSYYIVEEKDVREKFNQYIKHDFPTDRDNLNVELSRLLGVTEPL